MKKITIVGPKLLIKNNFVENLILKINGQCIDEITPINNSTEDDIEALAFPKDYYCIPGMFDLHIHGTHGMDFMFASHQQIESISDHLAKEGITSYLATTISDEIEHIEKVLATLGSPTHKTHGMMGIHLEGPFISREKVGIHDAKFCLQPDVALLEKWQKIANTNIKRVTFAPELLNKVELDRLNHFLIDNNIIPSYGHSNASWDDMRDVKCFYATHLFNAMREINHRDPGIAIKFLLDDKAYVEIIADGIHVHPAMLKMILKVKPKNKIILVTDAMCGKGMDNGKYQIGNKMVTVKNGKAFAEDNRLAGSVLDIPKAIKNMLAYTNCALVDIIKMVTENPAAVLGCDHVKAKIKQGYDADLVILDDQLNVFATFRAGCLVYSQKALLPCKVKIKQFM